MLRVLIVDDSPVFHKLYNNFLGHDKDLTVVANSYNPYEATQVLNSKQVDLIILDAEMPKMDGLTFLNKIRDKIDIPIIVVSSTFEQSPDSVNKFLECGAYECLSKPKGSLEVFFNELIEKIKIAGNTSAKKSNTTQKKAPLQPVKRLLIIAASTGSTENVKKIITSLNPAHAPTTIVIQHMPENFTKIFADSIAKTAMIPTHEANFNDILENGICYIAKGNYHLKVFEDKLDHYKIILSNDSHVHNVRPAADITLLSLPDSLAKKTTVIILSGMGRDGADGVAHLKKLGATIVAEDESTCVVFGMPKAAIETGCVDHIMPIDDIIKYVSNIN